jgi:hypothetical protein
MSELAKSLSPYQTPRKWMYYGFIFSALIGISGPANSFFGAMTLFSMIPGTDMRWNVNLWAGAILLNAFAYGSLNWL